jgi:hypothetical protein
VGSDAISEVAKGAGVGVAFGRVEVGGGMGDVEMVVAAVCCLRRAGFSHYNSIV